jgi:hypothetical protein
MDRYVVVDPTFSEVLEDAYTKLPKAAFCAMRGIDESQAVEGVTIRPGRLAVRDNAGQPEVYELPQDDPRPKPPHPHAQRLRQLIAGWKADPSTATPQEIVEFLHKSGLLKIALRLSKDR